MKTEHTKPLAQIALHHHEHGVSYGVVPPGIEPEDYFRQRDGFDRTTDWTESSALDAPYCNAPALLAENASLLQQVETLQCANLKLRGVDQHAEVARLREALERVQSIAKGDGLDSLRPFGEVDVMSRHARNANASVARGVFMTVEDIARAALQGGGL